MGGVKIIEYNREGMGGVKIIEYNREGMPEE